MGARHSKRSVDITTTPKKGEDGVAVIEGEEGKLEKIAELDIKATINGTLHNEIEFADKEETSKDETEDKEKVESKTDIKENGLPEEPSNAVSECKKAEGDVEKPSEESLNGETLKTPEKETADQKIEETTEQKKKKEKKKKWSFRSISFSKKDKSKPSKESGDKSIEVKEVAEENAEEKTSPTSEEVPKSEETKPTENSVSAVTNGDASPSEVSAKTSEAEPPKPSDEAEKPKEEPAKAEEPKPDPVKAEEVKKEESAASIPEPVVESISPAASEEVSKVEERIKEIPSDAVKESEISPEDETDQRKTVATAEE